MSGSSASINLPSLHDLLHALACNPPALVAYWAGGSEGQPVLAITPAACKIAVLFGSDAKDSSIKATTDDRGLLRCHQLALIAIISCQLLMNSPHRITDIEMEALFRKWWSESYPTPPGTHALMTHLGWGRHLLETLDKQQRDDRV